MPLDLQVDQFSETDKIMWFESIFIQAGCLITPSVFQLSHWALMKFAHCKPMHEGLQLSNA